MWGGEEDESEPEHAASGLPTNYHRREFGNSPTGALRGFPGSMEQLTIPGGIWVG